MSGKECRNCGEFKPLDEFYKHPQMSDGHLNTCIPCKKGYAKERYREKAKDPEWAKKERERTRKKYHRLNYKDRYSTDDKARQQWKQRNPEKVRALNKSSHIKAPEGVEKHHWSYRDGDEKSVIFLTVYNHNLAHRLLTYNKDKKLYEDKNGNLLDTKEKHLQYLTENGVEIRNSNLDLSKFYSNL